MLEAEKISSKNGTENKTREVLQILASKGQMSSEDIAKQCSFESRMAAAGVIALLRRQKAIELVPESYRITNAGRIQLEDNQQQHSKPEPKIAASFPML